MGPTIQTGSVFDRSISALTARFGPLYGSVLLIYLPLVGGLLYLNTRPASEKTTILLVLFGIMSYVLLVPLASAAVIRGVYRHLRGQNVRFDDCWQGLGRLWLRLLLVSILVGLATGVGYMLCLIPGLIAQAGLFVSVPALVVEDTGVGDALDRSWKLTDGHRLRIFFIVLGLGLISLLVQFFVGKLVGSSIISAQAGQILIQVFQSLLTAFEAVVAGVVYFDLRQLREGLDLDDLASVFD